MAIYGYNEFSVAQGIAHLRYRDTALTPPNDIISHYTYTHSTRRVTSDARSSVVISLDDHLKAVRELSGFLREIHEKFPGPIASAERFSIVGFVKDQPVGDLYGEAYINGVKIWEISRNVGGVIEVEGRPAVDWTLEEFGEFVALYEKFAFHAEKMGGV